MKKLITIVALLTALFACETESFDLSHFESLYPPDPINIEPIVMSNSMAKAPDQSGFIVTRDGKEILATLLIDFKAGLTASMAADNNAFCNPFPNFDALELVPVQQVDIPNDQFRRQILANGETYVEVFDGVLNGFICDFFSNTPRLASGNANFVFTDNDFDIFLRDDPANANAYGINLRGNLQDQNGESVDLKVNYRAVWDGIDIASLREQVKISLR